MGVGLGSNRDHILTEDWAQAVPLLMGTVAWAEFLVNVIQDVEPLVAYSERPYSSLRAGYRLRLWMLCALVLALPQPRSL